MGMSDADWDSLVPEGSVHVPLSHHFPTSVVQRLQSLRMLCPFEGITPH